LVLKAVSERTQPLEKFGGFKLPARNYSAAMPRKSWAVLPYRRAKLFCCNAAKGRKGFNLPLREKYSSSPGTNR
jgi:hypothetical protein